jgi:hypothetical protein
MKRGPYKKKVRTHCKHGHVLTPENTYISPNKSKRRYVQTVCRTCTGVSAQKKYIANRDIPTLQRTQPAKAFVDSVEKPTKCALVLR